MVGAYKTLLFMSIICFFNMAQSLFFPSKGREKEGKKSSNKESTAAVILDIWERKKERRKERKKERGGKGEWLRGPNWACLSPPPPPPNHHHMEVLSLWQVLHTTVELP